MDDSPPVENHTPRTAADRPNAPDQTPHGVLVLGMHRSGTSAVAGVANLLGLATCVPDDLITGMAWNPRGHWESRSLTRFNDQLITAMDRTWWYPPPSGAGFPEVASVIDPQSAMAARYFDRVHPSEPWVWKDPRTCLVLPFWRRALDRPVAGIAVFRHPVDVATSLQYRNSLPLPFGVALWERYARLLLEHAVGMPLMVSSYDDLVQDPVRWSESAHAFLAGLGIAVHSGAEDEIRRFVDPGLRHSHERLSEGFRQPPGATEVYEALESCVGVHRSFEPPALAVEDPAVGDELRSRWPDRPPAWNLPPWSTEDVRVAP
jgi:hypothetical protein